MAVRHVLVVEDDAAVSEALQELLQRSGLAAFAARTTDEAERIFREVPVDAVLLDGTLGAERLNAVSLLKRIRSGGFTGPVIAISGHDEHNNVLCQNGATVGILKVFCRQIIETVKKF